MHIFDLLIIVAYLIVILGLVISAYFSAIMSTADSCMMAASGNLLTDVLRQHNNHRGLRYSQVITFAIGASALLLAMSMENVLELMLHSYAFMVAGMFVPVLAALVHRRPDPVAAFYSMITGGAVSLTLILAGADLPLGLDPIVFGIAGGALVYVLVAVARMKKMAAMHGQ
ncbi:MAG: hypothetical protein P1P82_06225 [Bacteroidales bacterium]|nr:hypothetical protein [Bacteroidales bacterium]MDT8430456.1 hypothetical protein [Bacteroidales bacterium]